jgi:SSS family solute:Na+ symporter
MAFFHVGNTRKRQGFSGLPFAASCGGYLDRRGVWPGRVRGAVAVSQLRHARTLVTAAALAISMSGGAHAAGPRQWLDWQSLPPLPDPSPVAGQFVGMHRGGLVVAGGVHVATADAANLRQVPEQFHAGAYVLMPPTANGGEPAWHTKNVLDHPVAFGASASTPAGIVCAGGEDGNQVFVDTFLLTWDPAASTLARQPLPPLPFPSTAGGATLLGQHVYVIAGQDGLGLDSATDRIWRLRIDALGKPIADWEPLPAVPGGPRAYPMVAAQHDGFAECLYVIGGRRHRPRTPDAASVETLADCHEFSPARHAVDPATAWRRCADLPTPLMAGTVAALGQSHLIVLAAADDGLSQRIATPELPGGPSAVAGRAWAYHTITDTWTSAGSTPAFTTATSTVVLDSGIVLVGGELPPRTPTSGVWRLTARPNGGVFGWLDYAVLVAYLAAMVGVGVYFMNRMKDTDDFFRGGQQMRWWAAGCSIFATMLSSITFMSIPAKAFAQDWVYAVGNLMILAVAPVAVFLALPFFRRIDATSVYEYLELRFNRQVRLFASGLFTTYHVFRMAIVMSLAALALAVVMPLTPAQGVLLMGVLSILYCTLGGVEAVIWTDTIQTGVLLGGAMLCLLLMLAGCEGGVAGAVATATAGGKFHAANFHLDATTANLALWVVIVGGLGQNFSNYISDQAIVQRYMTTPDERRAGTSIWLAAGLSAVATFLFFGLGTGLYAFYKAHPDRLDPSFATDQIFPLFILRETFPGVAGLIVAGIFAAAQSTISTSMNSTATTVVTDFLRPFKACGSESGYLRMARWLTFGFGLAGTLLALAFIDSGIRSLFDEFIKVMGVFMGVLGGLFALGMLTRRATGPGALVGVAAGASTMMALPLISPVNGYLYSAIGIATCFTVGVVASLVLPARPRNLAGLTVWPQESSP